MQLETENAGGVRDPLAAAIMCIALVGCRQQQVGAVLTFTVQPTAAIGIEEAKSSVVKVINDRHEGAGQARPLAGAEVAVDLYGELPPEEVDFLQRFVSMPGALEFRIMASPAVARHKPFIELAQQLGADDRDVQLDDRVMARWVEYSPKEFGDADQARARGLVVRMAGDAPQALALLDDDLNVTGQFLRSAAADVDETGRPQISFTFNSQGAFRLGQLTGNHVPTSAGQRYMLGILLDDRLLSAPTIESKITERGRISGGSMDEQQVLDLVAILNGGALPCPIKLINVSTPEQGK